MRAVPALLTLVLACGLARGADQPDAYLGPSEADIRAAYEQKLDEVNAGTKRFLSDEVAPHLIIELTKLDFVECDPVSQQPDHFRCSVLIQSSLGGQALESARIELVLYKEAGVWKAL